MRLFQAFFFMINGDKAALFPLLGSLIKLILHVLGLKSDAGKFVAKIISDRELIDGIVAWLKALVSLLNKEQTLRLQDLREMITQMLELLVKVVGRVPVGSRGRRAPRHASESVGYAGGSGQPLQRPHRRNRAPCQAARRLRGQAHCGAASAAEQVQALSSRRNRRVIRGRQCPANPERPGFGRVGPAQTLPAIRRRQEQYSGFFRIL